MKTKRYFYLLLLVLCSACSNGGSNNQSNGNSSFTAKIDGQSFVARHDLIFTLELNGKYLAIGGTNDNMTNIKTIDFTITMDAFQGLSNGLEITDATAGFYVEANFVDQDQDIDAWEDEPGASYFIKIISVDYDNGLVSGEFNFTLVDDELSQTVNITEGEFSNIKF
ncbi:hypothetical protein H7U19_01085 [Hyunsoonleella sp. SJ7]|uniref:Uncharacterized protein n=1 Tax=Hyunsoonleella aquatilis TaxID=2762758 RepID=A0A923H7F4_9FLAO|nr:DUF6252 family protein [Hyunsoonleella aquatilis]MBC3756978.1 hypothetical protein [Hyunsoonleella aquatilis]